MIPLSVIGGFLGAGKTTLVNHLLATAERRWGVLVNDFGAVNIDAALVAARDGDSIALSNGCLCCSLGDDLGDALARMAARRPDHILIEASGVADPRRIAQLALVEPGFTLEPIVVLVDAESLDRHLADPYVADAVRGQIEAAELLLLTRTDAVAPAQQAGVAGRLQALRPGVPLLAAPHGAVAAAALSFPHAPPPRFIAAAPPLPFHRWHWPDQGSFDPAALRALLQALPPSVLRVKGFCSLGPEAAPQLLQFAGGRWAFTPAAPSSLGLVVIGTSAMPDDLDARFRAALQAQPGGQ